MTSPARSGETGSGGASGGPLPPVDEPQPAFAGTDAPAAPASRLAGWRLSPARMRLLALLSALATGVVIWAGLSREDDTSGLAAAIAHRNSLLASAAGAASAAPSLAATPAEGSPINGGALEPAPPAVTAPAGESRPPAAPSAATPEPAEPRAQQPLAATSNPAAPAPPSVPAVGSLPTGTPIKHVFVITLASPGYEQTWGAGSAARYLTTQLRPQGTLLSNYYAIGHLDLPNYIAMISGQPPNAQTSADCSTFAQFPAGSKVAANGALEAPGCVYPVSVLTLADQLTSSRRQWRGYIEDLANGPKPVQSCRHPTTDQPDETQHARPGDAYAARHNPFVYFHSLLDLGDCASDDLPLTQLATDLASPAKTPNYSFIAPNLCHDGSEAPCLDGSPGGLQASDAFLAQWVPKILASPAYRADGLLVITFADGPPGDSSGCCQSAGAGALAGSASGGGRVGALLLSRFVTPGGESTAPYNHYSLLRTVEDIFGLPHLADAGRASVSSFSGDVLKGVFSKRR
jgi:hypothetical protein